ncbi:tetratricopeptide repeat protein [Acuticoccus sp. I52.16.1]|uniref:tetratricopeptide repeat protein n=1 Tax=Acuticoccus sp. I52.16.1 TaxID=2928472 RepID=UPI001FD12FFD|nr:tetratricopeptide repeat protein [Acuticoccus sp. I52.16.1]UOM36730.1 tetratricopeptide repeat protein [Acuticoccus sp. I52.16.1]
MAIGLLLTLAPGLAEAQDPGPTEPVRAFPAIPPDIRMPSADEARALADVADRLAGAAREDITPLAREALAIETLTYGPSHPETANTYLWLAMGARSAGDLVAARRFQQRAYEVFDARLGPLHRSTLDAQGPLASDIYMAGDFEAAIDMAQNLADHAAAEGENDIAAKAMGMVAFAAQQIGNRTLELEAAQKVVALALTIQGPETEYVQRWQNHADGLLAADAVDLYNEAGSLASAGRLDEAIDILARSVEAFNRALGPDNRLTRLAREEHGKLVRQAGRLIDVPAAKGRAPPARPRLFDPGEARPR